MQASGAVAFACVLRFAVLLVFANVANAQTLSVQVNGRVFTADTTPIVGAVIRVLGTRWATTSTADGRFTLAFPEGRWRLLTSRIGYVPDTVSFDVARSGIPDLIIRMRAAPLALAGISVQASQAPPMSTSVTTETARAVPPLGEPDLFRSIALLPNASQPNDLKGRIHLAGGASDETGISLDGHPLHDPLHLLGLLGAFNVAALERATVMMHHVPVEEAGRLSGLIAMETRLPTSRPSREVVTSLLSTSITVSDDRIPAGLDLLASARATYLDRIVMAVAPDARIAGEEIPLLSYQDALLRIGRRLSRGWRAEALGFATRDRIGVTERLQAAGQRPLEWGESMVGVRLQHSSTPWRAIARASVNHGFVDLRASAQRPTFVQMSRRSTSSALKVVRSGRSWRAAAGASLDERTHANAWRAFGLGQQIFSPNTPSDYDAAALQREWGIFTEGSSDLSRALSITIGVRGTKVRQRWHPAPRALASFVAGSSRAELSAERRHQYFTEIEEPIEGNITPPTFFLVEPRTADVLALRVELPVPSVFGSVTSSAIQGFHKRYSRRPILSADTGGSAGAFPQFERVGGSGSGVSVSWRTTWRDDALLQGSYSFQRSRERVDGEWSPTGWDAPHDLTVFGTVPVASGWSLNAVYRGHSGRAVTPIVARLFAPFPELETSLQAKYLRGTRNSARVAAYHRVDVGARRSWSVRGGKVTAFAQVLNVTNRQNPIDYTWDLFEAVGTNASRPTSDRAGLPVLPTIGLEVQW